LCGDVSRGDGLMRSGIIGVAYRWERQETRRDNDSRRQAGNHVGALSRDATSAFVGHESALS
jgi:hypothetical protein